MTFACITAALVLGGVAERVKFAGVVIFAILWPLLVLLSDRAHGLVVVGRRRRRSASDWTRSMPARA